MSPIIDVKEATKVFHSTRRQPGIKAALRAIVAPERIVKTAVQAVSFEIEEGQLVTLLGPNGAGKSTTIKMLTGILTPTSGSIRVAGVEPACERERNARSIGAVFGQRTQLWWDLPVRESFSILRDIYGVPELLHRARLQEFDDLLELSSFWDTRVRHLSLGQRVRCDLAAALLHSPTVVFLDEPTIGMDVVVKEQVRSFLLHQVRQFGLTVLLTTHDLVEVEQLAERVILIKDGVVELDGPLTEMRRRFGGSWQIKATLAEPAASRPPIGTRILRQDHSGVLFGPDGTRDITSAQALSLIAATYELDDITVKEADLEAVLRSAYRGPTAAPTVGSP